MDSGKPRPKLRKVKDRGWLGGVCAGIGYWLGIPTWLVRVVWAFLGLVYGLGVLLYVLLWIFMPKWEEVPDDYAERAGG
jgi:phage shock protein PspC (stress-responsive transcriptional regulator)